jgi:hypothetical protein
MAEVFGFCVISACDVKGTCNATTMYQTGVKAFWFGLVFSINNTVSNYEAGISACYTVEAINYKISDTPENYFPVCGSV